MCSSFSLSPFSRRAIASIYAFVVKVGAVFSIPKMILCANVRPVSLGWNSVMSSDSIKALAFAESRKVPLEPPYNDQPVATEQGSLRSLDH